MGVTLAQRGGRVRGHVPRRDTIGGVDSWVWWLVAGVLLGIAELFTGTFVLIMFSGGALAAAVAAALGAPLGVQALVFAIGSVLGLFAARPLRDRMNPHPAVDAGGVAGIEGADCEVLEQVDALRGQVKIGGEIWSARAYDATQVFEVGERVRVIDVKGATALVWRD
jgi:membrane protein implicated in regulation of membrane protease activity